MDSFDSPPNLAEFISPLLSQFDGLTFSRDGNVARWGYEGHAVVIELLPPGRVRASFVERPSFEARTAEPASALYAGTDSSYPLNAYGGARFVADVAAFFTGTREP